MASLRFKISLADYFKMGQQNKVKNQTAYFMPKNKPRI
jgi:hypothetical protein